MPKRKGAAISATSTSLTKKQRRVELVQPRSSDLTPVTRASNRLKTVSTSSLKVSPVNRKSKYFQQSDQEGKEPEEEELEHGDHASSSGYEDAESSDSERSQSEAEQSVETEEEEDDTKKPKRGRQSKKKADPPQSELYNKSDLWREGVKTGLGPGKAVFIERPKARGDLGIKYVPDRIHPATMEFLADLKKNNDRVWLKAHDADFRASWKDFESFLGILSEKIAEIDETIPELPPKDLFFRIYRDVRFSPDQTPYKPHFSAAFSRTGRKGPYACYYVQIQPGGKSFVGAGLWHPDAAPLALLRQNIDQSPDEIKTILSHPDLRKRVLEVSSKDSQLVVNAFCKRNSENALKTKPKGFDADHPNLNLLRLRNFTIGQSISDKTIASAEGLERILELITAMRPFVIYLNNIVMPDAAAADDDQTSSSESESSDPDGE